MPLRRSTVYALDVIAYTRAASVHARPARQLRARTSARSRRRSAGTAARCGEREVGPFSRRRAAVSAVRVRSRRCAPEADGAARRGAVGVNVARVAGGARRAERARGRDRHASTACIAGTGGCSRRRDAAGSGPTVVTFDPHPRIGVRQPGRAALDARAAARAARREPASRRCSSSSSRRARAARAARRSPRTCCARSAPRGRRGRGLPLRARAAAGDLGAARAARLRRRGRCRSSRASRRRAIRDAARARATSQRRRALLGRPAEVEGIVVIGDQRGGTLGYPTANLARRPGAARARATASTPARARGHRAAISIGDEPALRRRRAADRGVPARLRRRPLRRSGSWSSSGSGCGTRGRSSPRPSSSPRSRATWSARGGAPGRTGRLTVVRARKFAAQSGVFSAWTNIGQRTLSWPCSRASAASSAARYAKPTAGGTRRTNPGCPDCGYVGWIGRLAA